MVATFPLSRHSLRNTCPDAHAVPWHGAPRQGRNLLDIFLLLVLVHVSLSAASQGWPSDNRRSGPGSCSPDAAQSAEREISRFGAPARQTRM